MRKALIAWRRYYAVLSRVPSHIEFMQYLRQVVRDFPVLGSSGAVDCWYPRERVVLVNGQGIDLDSVHSVTPPALTLEGNPFWEWMQSMVIQSNSPRLFRLYFT